MWRATGGRVDRSRGAPPGGAAATGPPPSSARASSRCSAPGSPPPCLAVDWLVLVVDRSNSIDDRELALQRNAYVRLLSDAQRDRGARAGAQVAIVEFDSRSEIVVDWTDPAAAALAYRRKSPDGLRGQTGIGSALTTALALLVGKSGRLVVDVSGDGRENVDHALLAQARAAATAQAIEINGLAIMTPRDARDRPLLQRRAWSTASSSPVEQRDDFLAALKRKLFYEVAGEPPAARASPGERAATP